jgi:hypothetical protein
MEFSMILNRWTFVCALALIASTAAAEPVNGRYFEERSGALVEGGVGSLPNSDFAAELLTPSLQGFWAAGSKVDGDPVLVRYRNGSAALAVDSIRPERMAGNEEGDVVLVGAQGIQSFSFDGAQRFRFGGNYAAPRDVRADRAGNALFKRGNDTLVASPFGVVNLGVTDAAEAAADRAGVFIGVGSVLKRMAVDGNTVWQRDFGAGKVRALQPLEGGGVRAAVYDSGRLTIYFLNNEQVLNGQINTNVPDPVRIVSANRQPSERWVLLNQYANGTSIFTGLSAGSLVRPFELAFNPHCTIANAAPCELVGNSGDLYLVEPQANGTSSRVMRMSAAGDVLSDSIFNTGPASMVSQGVDWIYARGGGLRRVTDLGDFAGPSTRSAVPGNYRAVDIAAVSDERRYMLSVDAAAGYARLSRVQGNDAGLRYEFSGGFTPLGLIKANQDRFCALLTTRTGTFRMQCFTDIGNRLNLREVTLRNNANVAEAGSIVAMHAELSADNTMTVALQRSGRTFNDIAYLTIDFQGTLRSERSFYYSSTERARLLGLKDGKLLVRSADGRGQVYDTQADRAIYTSPSGDLVNAQFVDDGYVFEFASPPIPNVLRVTADGTSRWSRLYSQAQSTPISDGRLLIASVSSGLELLSATGQTLWARNDLPRPGFVQLRGNEVLYASTVNASTLFVTSLNLSNGNTLGVRQYGCGNACELKGFQRAQDGIYLLTNVTRDSGRIAQLISVDRPFPATNIRVNQLGILGAWHDPLVPGQGIMLSRLPNSRTIFAGWFTYDTTVNDSDAGQRWLTLQGPLGDDATRISLGIFQTQGGAFLSAQPAPSTTQIGSAELSFSSCSTGRLTYTLTSDRQVRVINLERLTSPPSPCNDTPVLATQVVPNPVPEEQTISRNMQGGWYDPNQSGQGFFFNVFTPVAVNFDAAPQGMFGGWFSYDPQGTRNDPTAQHWFTVQQLRIPGAGDRSELGIYQTIGGVFASGRSAATVQVGTGSLQVFSCDNAEFKYQFDDVGSTGRFAGKSGTIQLRKLGGC